MGEFLIGHLFCNISESQSIQADIVNFSNFAKISSKRCKGIILGSKSREFSSFHVISFPFSEAKWLSWVIYENMTGFAFGGVRLEEHRWKTEDRYAKMMDDRTNQPFSPSSKASQICVRNSHQVYRKSLHQCIYNEVKIPTMFGFRLLLVRNRLTCSEILPCTDAFAIVFTLLNTI